MATPPISPDATIRRVFLWSAGIGFVAAGAGGIWQVAHAEMANFEERSFYYFYALSFALPISLFFGAAFTGLYVLVTRCLAWIRVLPPLRRMPAALLSLGWLCWGVAVATELGPRIEPVLRVRGWLGVIGFFLQFAGALGIVAVLLLEMLEKRRLEKQGPPE